MKHIWKRVARVTKEKITLYDLTAFSLLTQLHKQLIVVLDVLKGEFHPKTHANYQKTVHIRAFQWYLFYLNRLKPCRVVTRNLITFPCLGSHTVAISDRWAWRHERAVHAALCVMSSVCHTPLIIHAELASVFSKFLTFHPLWPVLFVWYVYHHIVYLMT